MGNPLVVDALGQAIPGGIARVGTLNGELFFNQIGPNIADGGWDPTRAIQPPTGNHARRFFGQIFAGVQLNSVTFRTRVMVYDEGGTNNWTVSPTAKGAQGVTDTGQPSLSNYSFAFVEVMTAAGPYLVGAGTGTPSNPRRFARFDPRTGVNGTWSFFNGVNSGNAGEPHAIFVHDGIVYTGSPAQQQPIQTFEPITGGVAQITYPFPTDAFQNMPVFFTLHGRLFGSWNANTGSPYTSRFAELIAGSFVEIAGLTSNQGGNGVHARTCIPISPTKVLIFGHGYSNTAGVGGVMCHEASTVGDSPTGALQIVDRTIAVVPAALRPSGGGYGGLGTTIYTGMRARVTTSDPIGVQRNFLMYYPNIYPPVAPTAATVFEVFDESTEMQAVNGTVQADSDFIPPVSFYGAGALENGVDRSTRLVSPQGAGWASGNSGLVVKVFGCGDGPVLAYHNLAGGPFTVGETIQGATSLATGVLIGDGAAEGLYLRDVVGTFQGDEQISGLTSLATADLNLVLPHGSVTTGPFQVGETVTDLTSGATGTVTHLGLGGSGEQLVKVIWTNSPTAFGNGNVIQGSISGAQATLSSAPLGSWGGLANKTIRARYFFRASGPVGKGVPTTGYCTMVAGSGFKGTVSKGTGPTNPATGLPSDELINVIADGAVGPGTSPPSFEWDFLSDGVSEYLVTTLAFEIDRA